MARRIVTTNDSLKRIRDVGSASPRVDPAMVAEALGAEDVGTSIGMKGGPASLFLLRAELARRLHSRGGRPALAGVTRRVKIPITDSQWRELEDLAAALSERGFSPSAGQVASALLSLSLPLAKRETQSLRKQLASHASPAERVH
jgi:hypothetical protein